jgi:hypothetical protein
MILGPSAVIYGFIAAQMPWDFYLLNVLWVFWSLWALSGICLAAIKRHKWPDRFEPDDVHASSFFVRTRELFITIVLTILFTAFFATLDTARVDRIFHDLRHRILASENAATVSLPPVEKIISENVGANPGKTVAAPPQEARQELFTPMQWTVQVASVRNQRKAMLLQEQLMSAGFPARATSTLLNELTWIRIEVGSFSSKDKAQEVSGQIRGKGISTETCCWVKKIPEAKREASR